MKRSFFAPVHIFRLLGHLACGERVNLYKTCIIYIHLCLWFQKGPYALGFLKIMLIIIMSLFIKL